MPHTHLCAHYTHTHTHLRLPNTHTCTHTHMHMYTHTHTHTYSHYTHTHTCTQHPDDVIEVRSIHLAESGSFVDQDDEVLDVLEDKEAVRTHLHCLAVTPKSCLHLLCGSLRVKQGYATLLSFGKIPSNMPYHLRQMYQHCWVICKGCEVFAV